MTRTEYYSCVAWYSLVVVMALLYWPFGHEWTGPFVAGAALGASCVNLARLAKSSPP